MGLNPFWYRKFGFNPLLGLEPMAPILPQLPAIHANHSATYVCMYICMYVCIYACMFSSLFQYSSLFKGLNISFPMSTFQLRTRPLCLISGGCYGNKSVHTSSC